MEQRELALNILCRTIEEESYSNLLMRKELNKIPALKRAFVTNLVNGVLRKYEFLNYQFEDEIRKSTSLRCRLILCMAMFERFFLKEKDYAVNNEYVNLGKNRYEKGFINAVLRKCDSLKHSSDPSIEACLPKWIYSLLASQYTEEELREIVRVYQRIPEVAYRINKRKCSFDDLQNLEIEILDEDLFRSDKNLLETSLYRSGWFYVQDPNSASLYRHLDLNKDDVVLDVCSAPGSKLFNCLDIVKEDNAFANDIHENRVQLIRNMADRLGLHGIHYSCEDGRKLKDTLDVRFDRILLDAPCSGLGVIGRKPDLKFHVRPESLDELQKLQMELLLSMNPLLKEGGILLYSTCTLNKKENGRLVRRFLEKNVNYLLLEEETIINGRGDCFYYAKMKKE